MYSSILHLAVVIDIILKMSGDIFLSKGECHRCVFFFVFFFLFCFFFCCCFLCILRWGELTRLLTIDFGI